jgi:DNA polymerase III subunit delta
MYNPKVLIMNNVYLLLGPEEGEKNTFIENQIKSIKKQIGEDPEVEKVYPYGTDMVDIVSGLENVSLFSGHRVVILNNTEEIKQGAGLNVLVDYCNNPSDNSTLFMLSETVSGVSKKIEKAVPKKSRIIFWELFENRKADWIRGYFMKKNIRIDADAVSLIIEMVNGNTMDLKNECGKLSLFFGENTELKIEDIEKYLFHSKEENVFTLFNFIAARDLPGALEALNKILLSKESEPVGIIAGVLWQVRKLLEFKKLVSHTYSPDDAFVKINIRNKRSRKIYSTAEKNYTLSEIRSLIILINEYDERIRSVKGDMHHNLLELFIYTMIVRGGKMVSIG